MADQFNFEISLSVLNHLGRNLYRNFITVLAEAVSNSWDADAKNVWINIDTDKSSFSIKDDGDGMSPEDFQGKFLKIGYSKRKDGHRKSGLKRPYIGAKGIGKLALLSCAKRVSIFTKTKESEYTGGVIDNTGLDKAIKNDNTADEYPLEVLDFSLIEGLSDDHDKGTIIVFDGVKDKLNSSPQHIKKMLALSFKFSVVDPSFNIFVNGDLVSELDLKDLADSTEFVWIVNGYGDSYTRSLSKLKSDPIVTTTSLGVKGFAATVEKPRNLKITGTDERATIDLFVNGRLREKNIIRHIPTQRIVESYLYGQIHFDIMDRDGVDPFTSSREGIVEDDTRFLELMSYLKDDLIPKIIDEWDDLRLDRGQEGDDENPRKTKKARKARDLYNLTTSDFSPGPQDAEKDQVDAWLDELRGDAEFNLQAYTDCFLSENLVRKLLIKNGSSISDSSKKEAEKWKKAEVDGKGSANISFDIRKDNSDLYYLDMHNLAYTAEGSKGNSDKPSLYRDATSYKPVRNAVGHTGLLTGVAKNHLNATYENIKSRVRALLKGAV